MKQRINFTCSAFISICLPSLCPSRSELLLGSFIIPSDEEEAAYLSAPF